MCNYMTIGDFLNSPTNPYTAIYNLYKQQGLQYPCENITKPIIGSSLFIKEYLCIKLAQTALLQFSLLYDYQTTLETDIINVNLLFDFDLLYLNTHMDLLLADPDITDRLAIIKSLIPDSTKISVVNNLNLYDDNNCSAYYPVVFYLIHHISQNSKSLMKLLTAKKPIELIVYGEGIVNMIDETHNTITKIINTQQDETGWDCEPEDEDFPTD